jgi:hypothetical protein
VNQRDDARQDQQGKQGQAGMVPKVTIEDAGLYSRPDIGVAEGAGGCGVSSAKKYKPTQD